MVSWKAALAVIKGSSINFLSKIGEADFDEHRADVRSFGGNGHDHREYDGRGG